MFVQFARSGAAAAIPRLVAVCQAIATRVTPSMITLILARLLDGAGWQDDAAVLTLGRVVPDDVLAACVRQLDGGPLARLVALLDAPEPRPRGLEPLPRGRELAVAAALADHADPAVLAWSARMRTIEPPPAAAPVTLGGRPLTDVERSQIARRLAAARLPPEWQFQLCLGLGDGDGALVLTPAQRLGGGDATCDAGAM